MGKSTGNFFKSLVPFGNCAPIGLKIKFIYRQERESFSEKCLVQDHNIVKKYLSKCLKTSCVHRSMEILKKGLLKINSQVLSVPRNKKTKTKPKTRHNQKHY